MEKKKRKTGNPKQKIDDPKEGLRELKAWMEACIKDPYIALREAKSLGLLSERTLARWLP